MLNSPRRVEEFDAAYYRRFYLNAATRAASRAQIDRQGALIASVVKQLDIRVRSILDVGCGLGWYKRSLQRTFPSAQYHGLEISKYLCVTRGWIHGSIADLQLKRRFDLVICSDVLQYLSTREAVCAIVNLAKCCRGAMYLHAPTRGDWTENVDVKTTDGHIYLRSAAWYRTRLREYFVHVGCGIHVRDDVLFAQLELEQPWR